MSEKDEPTMADTWEQFFDETRGSLEVLSTWGLTRYEAIMVIILQSINFSLSEIAEAEQFNARELIKTYAYRVGGNNN